MPPDDRAIFDQSGSEAAIEADQAEELRTSERDETISWIREQIATGKVDLRDTRRAVI